MTPTMTSDPRDDAAPSATTPSDRLVEEVGRLRARRAGRDRLLATLGAVAMAVGVVAAVVAYAKSATADDLLVQNDAQVLSVVALVVAVVGGVVFLRYSLAEFLRFWLARALLIRDDADR
jgi:ABC-type bacteriocin/lantibiotic exporter with double-glycine peptidase domain